jgi:glycosyltransferase involved in cell wall biosynthesis
MEPLVSIGMPVHNSEETIGSALRSLSLQEYENWELILIDDGSSDRTLERAERHEDNRIRIICGKTRQGISRRLNQAVELSRGEYFARMDGDDIAYPERMRLQVEFLDKNPGVDLAGCRVLIFHGGGDIVGTYPFRQTHGEICRRPWSGFYLPHPTWMGKTVWFRRHPYRTEPVRTEDQELLLRTFSKSRFACLPHFLLGYRQVRLSLKAILPGRIHFALALLEGPTAVRRFQVALGVFEQFLKGVTDIFALTSGLNYRILRHRALPVPDSEVRRWREVWSAVNRIAKIG